MIEIAEVKSKKQLLAFLKFPVSLYRGDTCYVQEPLQEQKKLLTPVNPFFRHSQATLFIASEKGKPFGRVAAIHNHVHNELYREKTGFFGFFETVDKPEVSEILMDTVVTWHRKIGNTRLVGPTNLTTNDSCGFLVEGFGCPPVIGMPYNKAYYPDHMESLGFHKEMDLYSYSIDGSSVTGKFNALVDRIGQRLEESGIRVRNINFRNFDEELEALRLVYNKANRDNWGFMPLDRAEFRSMAGQLRQFVPEDLVLIAEKNRQTIGYLVSTPDLNQAFRHMRSGRMFPTGILKLLWYRRKIDACRVLIMGVDPDFTNKGIDLLLYKTLKENANRRGIFHCEACYVMEANGRMNATLEKIDGRRVKTYRLYSKTIG